MSEARPAPAHGPKLGIWMATALVAGNMIGSGVFLLPASLAPYGGISIVGWGFTTVGALVLAFVFADLGRAMPAVGGPYAYTRHAFGDFAGFLVAWGYWIALWCGNAAIAVGFAGYFSALVPGLDGHPGLQAGAATAAIWLLTAVNARGIREAGVVQLVTTVLKLVPLVLVATVGLLYFNGANFKPFNASAGSDLDAITATATLTLWAFLGLESASIPAGDIENARRTIPRATLAGMLLAAAVYILGTVAVMGVISPGALAGSTAPFADAASVMWGGWAYTFVAAGAAISAFGALNGWILVAGQIPLATAADRLFPSPFARVSRNGTPVFGLVISGVLATLLLALNYTRGLVGMFEFIVLLATLTTLVPYVFTAAAELLLLVREKERFEERRLRRHTVIASAAILYSLWAVAGSGQEIVFWGFLLLLAGVPAYVLIQRANAAHEETAE